MSTQSIPTSPAMTFTRAQWQMLRTLRTRYRTERDQFSDAERAHLHFVRWLYQTGRLVP